jgi:hypothetical protein
MVKMYEINIKIYILLNDNVQYYIKTALKLLQYKKSNTDKYKVVQIWPGLFVCKQVTVCPGHIWTTLY